MTPQDQALILKLMSGEIDKRAFLRRYSVPIDDPEQHVLDCIHIAREKRDTDELELAMFLHGYFSLPRDITPLLCELLLEDWHHEHEDIAFWLEELQDPAATDCLYKTAQTRLDYLAYNDSGALASKCIWGLGKIGTPRAIEMIRELQRHDQREMVQDAIADVLRYCDRRASGNKRDE